MSKHTPGPWKVTLLNSKLAYAIDGADGRYIGKAFTYDDIPVAVGAANAALIETAPDGLALAEMVLEAEGVMADSHPMAGKWAAIVDAARALKEKANG